MTHQSPSRRPAFSSTTSWVGIGTGVLAGGGILAALRRRFSKRRRATGTEETRID